MDDEPEHNRMKSAPNVLTPTDFNPLIQSNPQNKLKRRKTTVPHPENQYDPRFILELILEAPHEAYIGVGNSLKPLLERVIQDLQDEEQDIGIDLADQQLIETTLSSLGMESEEFKSFTPLRADITVFKQVLEQRYTSNLIKAICHALIGSFLAGYNTSLLNVPAILIQTECHLNITLFSSLQSFYCVGGLIGALCTGYIADKFGRKIALIFANCTFMLSGIISMLYAFDVFGPHYDPSITFIYFIISRVLSGFASGMSTAIVPTYLGEIAPPLIRGEIGTLNAFINAAGLLFAELIGFQYIFGNIYLWKCLFLVNIIPGCIQLIASKTLSESPQWLLINGKKVAARNRFQYLRECDDVEFDMKSVKTKKLHREVTRRKSTLNLQDMKTPRSPLKSVNEYDMNAYNYGSATALLSPRRGSKKKINMVLFYTFSITILLQILQQFSGINSVWYYSSLMLQNAGLKSAVGLWIGNILIASSNFLGVLIPVKLIEKLGRKKLIYMSCCGMIIASIFLSIVLFFADDIKAVSGYLSIIILICYVISFAMGLGPIVGLLTVELSPSASRGSIVSIAFFINYLANLFVAQYANMVVAYAFYLPFAVICFLGILFTWFMIPETKGKNENDIQLALYKKVN
eukprot:121284_1